MNRDHFLRSSLGLWSSHPTFVAKRSRYACGLALVPCLVFLAWLGFRLRRGGDWFEMLDSAGTWMVVAAVILSFTTAALVTLALMTRLNRWQHASKHWSIDRQKGLTSASSGRPGVDPDWWILVPAILIGFAGPYFAARYLGSNLSGIGGSTFAIWTFRSLAFLPLFALLCITGVGGAVVDDPTLKRNRRPWLLVLSVCLGMAALMTALRDSLALIGNDQWTSTLDGYLPHHESLTPLVPGFILGVASAASFIAWRSWTTNSTSLERKARSVMDPRRLTSLLGEVLHTGSGIDSHDQAEDPSIPDWLLPILTSLRNADPVASPSKEDFQWLFSAPVSETSLASMQSAIRATDRLLQSDDVSRDHAAADGLLIYDEHESEIDLLVAFAVYQVLIRGQRVLWLIPNADQRDKISQAVEQSLARIAMAGLIRTGFIRSTSASEFAADETTLPHILMATPEHLRDFVWENVTIDIAQRKPFIQAFSIVCVGNISEFPEAKQLSVIGQLAAHRIVNSTAGSFTQIVLGTESGMIPSAKIMINRLSASHASDDLKHLPASLHEWITPLTPMYPNTDAAIEHFGSLPEFLVEQVSDTPSIAPTIYRGS